MAALGNLEAVILREQGGLLIFAELFQRRRVFVVMDIREALEEQQREDVGLKIRRIHRAAKDVRGLPEMGFKLGQSDGFGHSERFL